MNKIDTTTVRQPSLKSVKPKKKKKKRGEKRSYSSGPLTATRKHKRKNNE